MHGDRDRSYSRVMNTQAERRMTLTLDERTPAGRIGLSLIAARAELAAARDRGDAPEIDQLHERERTLTLDLLCAVTLPRLTFEVFGLGGSRATGGRR